MAISKTARTAIVVAATGTTFDWTSLTLTAVATRYILELPNYTNTITTTLSIIDANTVTVYSGAAHAQNANYSVPIDVEMVGTYTVRLTVSGVAGAGGGTAYVTLMLRS